ncbi:hypothetical protein ElyMa_000389500 [Elysia marginata]|uniref:Uncharacterized protein n=1 Tax=Elysia marginata TaxID=1093978 RepID=A0AAV4FIW2_9GAST|nr:hypothetical protein ElyMa_000389500 [Elysia marginata]
MKKGDSNKNKNKINITQTKNFDGIGEDYDISYNKKVRNNNDDTITTTEINNNNDVSNSDNIDNKNSSNITLLREQFHSYSQFGKTERKTHLTIKDIREG